MRILQALHDWQNFYILTGTAAATLMGLLFVAISISVGTSMSFQEATDSIRTFVTPILLAYAQALLLCCMSVMPLQSAYVFIAVLFVQGCLMLLVVFQVIWRIFVVHRKDVDKSHWAWHILLPLMVGLCLLAAAFGLLWEEPLTTACMALADLLCLAIGLRNSWVLMIWLLLYPKQGSSSNSEHKSA